MTLAEASAITSSDGKRYGDIDSATLTHMQRSIAKKLRLPDLPEADRTEATVKAQAIAVILANRAQGDTLMQELGF
jgi:hypothetical protein